MGILPARTLEWVATPSSRGIFPTQGSNSGLPHCGRILYPLSHQGSIPECCRLAKYPAFPWGATSAPSRGPARGQAKEGGGTCASTASPRSRGLPRLNLASDRRGLPPPLVPRRQVDLQLSPPPAALRAPTRALSPRRPNLAPGNPGRCSFRQLWGEREGRSAGPDACPRPPGARDLDPRCGLAQEGRRGRAVGWLRRRRFQRGPFGEGPWTSPVASATVLQDFQGERGLSTRFPACPQ